MDQRIVARPDNVNLTAECATYKWAEDKEGKIIDGKPVDFNNHLLDALHYALHTHEMESLGMITGGYDPTPR